MLFGKKKEKEKKESTPEPAAVQQKGPSQVSSSRKQSVVADENLASVLQNPRITEKATESSMQGVYVFDVSPKANKKQIAAAVRSVYKVEPRKIRIVPVPYKKTRHARTGIWGVRGGGKKAYVYLKEGDSISIM